MTSRNLLAALAALLLLLAACGDVSSGAPPAGRADPARQPATSSTDGDSEEELVAAATVLEKDGGGAMLCLGGVATSLPPQCGGPVITNWDWTDVADADSRAGTTWGEYVVVGTYDGTTFTLTREPMTREEYDGPPLATDDEQDLTTPCPEPSGGWGPVEPGRATDITLETTVGAAHALPGFADLWLDQSPNDADPQRDGEAAMNDPTRLVLNVRVTEDVAGAERRLRETWGGALCVSRAVRTAAELRSIQSELNEQVQGLLWSSFGRDTVDVSVVHDDGSLQQEVDERYGAGVVRVSSVLRPYRDQRG